MVFRRIITFCFCWSLVLTAQAQEEPCALEQVQDRLMEIDPNYINAKMNMVALILDQEQGIIDEMNNLGSSAADDKKYDELKAKRHQMYKDAVPYLVSVLEKEADNLSAAKTLMNIYSAIDDSPNFKAMKAKVDEMESKN